MSTRRFEEAQIWKEQLTTEDRINLRVLAAKQVHDQINDQEASVLEWLCQISPFTSHILENELAAFKILGDKSLEAHINLIKSDQDARDFRQKEREVEFSNTFSPEIQGP